MNHNVEGKVVVITGASSGLGEATARALSAQGARVVLGARRPDRIQALASELTSSGGNAIAVTTEVADRQQVKTLVDTAAEAYGRIDVMINNAGVMPQAPLERLRWRRNCRRAQASRISLSGSARSTRPRSPPIRLRAR
jgi:NADP-dependent 3-hydroxy acid dehydrogenase YdfG